MQRSVLGNNLLKDNSKLTSFSLNFGPQHPAAHGVLRLLLSLDGENIIKCDPHIGLLHRGTEKLIESKLFVNALPYFDRLDYVSILLQEHAFCIGTEKLLNKSPYTKEVAATRTILDELTRVFNHYLAIACHALDVGSMSPIFWCFEEREKIMEFYERLSGARMHANFYRPGIERRSLNRSISLDIADFIVSTLTTLNEVHTTLTSNKVWISRLKNIGTYSTYDASQYGATGVMARCTGLKRDVRINTHTTYNDYFFLNFRSFTSNEGDSYSRFLLRMYEIVESVNLINQSLPIFLKNSPNHLTYKSKLLGLVDSESTKMECTIKHFKSWSDGYLVSANSVYTPVESPKGEFGVFLIADSTNKPYRCKIRSPAYHHLQLLPSVVQGLKLADLVTVIGTIDIVFGEIDR